MKRLYPPCKAPRGYDESGRAVRCESLTCEGCRRRAADRRAAALAMARPERYLTLTGAAPDATYPKIAAMRKRLVINLRRAGYEIGEWAITIERNPKATGYHVNVLRHSGSKIPQRVLSECATRAGFAPRTNEQPVFDAQGISDYVVKDALDPESAAEYLPINGGRLTNTSHGYFRDLDGAPLRAKAADSLASSGSRTSFFNTSDHRDQPAAPQPAPQPPSGPSFFDLLAELEAADRAADEDLRARRRTSFFNTSDHRDQPGPDFDALLAELDAAAA